MGCMSENVKARLKKLVSGDKLRFFTPPWWWSLVCGGELRFFIPPWRGGGG